MALSHSPNIVTDNLQFYYDAVNKRSYNHGITSWIDLIRNTSNSLSNINSFDQNLGINTLTSLLFSRTFNFVANMTFEIWYRTFTNASGISNQSESPGIFQLGNYNANASFTIWDWSAYTPGIHNIRTLVNIGATWSHQGSSINNYTDAQWVGKWHQIVTVFSGTGGWQTYQLYIDKILQTTINLSSTVTSISGGNILGFPLGGGGAYNNSYSSLKVYNKSLSLKEITQNYDAMRGRFGL